MVKIQVNSQGKAYFTSGNKVLLASGGGDSVTATNITNAAINSGDKVWIKISINELDYTDVYNIISYDDIDNATLSGFAEENIAISGTGKVKTILPTKINVSVTTNADDATILLEL